VRQFIAGAGGDGGRQPDAQQQQGKTKRTAIWARQFHRGIISLKNLFSVPIVAAG
jgi:hypothetical protein